MICAKVVSSPWPCGEEPIGHGDLAGGVKPDDGALPQAALESDGACDLRWAEAADLDV